MFIRKHFVSSLVSLALALGLSSTAYAMEKLRLTIPVRSMNYYTVFVAHDMGFFKDEGVDMEVVVTQGDGPDVDALIAGSVQFTVTAPSRLLTAYQEGKNLLGVMNITKRIAINCFMNSESARKAGIVEDTPVAEKLKKLDGMIIGSTRPGAFTHLLATSYLQRVGYVPQEDVRIVGVGGGPSMLAAVERGQVDVGCLGSPTPELAVSRGSAIMFINNTQGEDKELEEFLYSLLYVRPEYAKENPESVRKVVRALKKAMDYILSAPYEEQEKVLRANFSGDVSSDILREALANTQATLEPTGEATKPLFDKAVQFFVSTGLLKGDVPFEAVIDNSYLSN